jgi:hypothetical protein
MALPRRPHRAGVMAVVTGVRVGCARGSTCTLPARVRAYPVAIRAGGGGAIVATAARNTGMGSTNLWLRMRVSGARLGASPAIVTMADGP